MALSGDIRRKVADFVDSYMKRYLQLRSEGLKPDAAIERIEMSCKEDAVQSWQDLSLSDRIMQWGSLSFTDEVSSLDPTDVEEDLIVGGLVMSMRIVCPESQSAHEQCAKWAREYLMKKYGIGGSVTM